MPTETLTDNTTFATVTLTQDELWQARGGSLLTSVEAILRPDQGIELEPGSVRSFKSGQTVRYRPRFLTNSDRMILVREAL